MQQLDLASGRRLVEPDEMIGSSQVAIPLRYLVAKDQRVAPDRCRQRGDQSVILVRIIGTRRQDHIAEPTWSGTKTPADDLRVKQTGAYAVGRFSLADPLHLIVGGRWSNWETNQTYFGS